MPSRFRTVFVVVVTYLRNIGFILIYLTYQTCTVLLDRFLSAGNNLSWSLNQNIVVAVWGFVVNFCNLIVWLFASVNGFRSFGIFISEDN